MTFLESHNTAHFACFLYQTHLIQVFMVAGNWVSGTILRISQTVHSRLQSTERDFNIKHWVQVSCTAYMYCGLRWLAHVICSVLSCVWTAEVCKTLTWCQTSFTPKEKLIYTVWNVQTHPTQVLIWTHRSWSHTAYISLYSLYCMSAILSFQSA